MDQQEADIPTFSDIARKVVSSGKSYYTQDEMLQIYTDWANHYLERSPRHKRTIQDLQQDIVDGVLLADIVEAVTNERLRDIKPKPKNATQMLENINVCLKCIENLGVSIEGLKAEDIREGNLRAILGLFFSLSRYKQQKKSGLLPPSGQSQLVPPSFTKIQPAICPSQNDVMLSRLPSPFKSAQSNRNSTGAIAQTATNVPSGGQNRRSLTSSQKEKVSSTNGPSNSGIPAPRSAQTSRPVSPGTSSSPHSLIPPPSSKVASFGEKSNRQSRSNCSSISSGVSAVSTATKTGSSANWSSPPVSSIPSVGAVNSTTGGVATTVAMGKNSMFAFGFFQKSKQEKTSSTKVTSKQSTERNSGCSSSSGFSSGSGKSEHSDNSSAAGSETLVTSPIFCPPPARETIYENTTPSITNSPKLAMKALARRTFSRSPATPAKEQARLLRMEAREEDCTPSRLPALTTPSLLEASAKKVTPVSKLPKPAMPVKIEPMRNSPNAGRGLPRPGESQMTPPTEENSPPNTEISVTSVKSALPEPPGETSRNPAVKISGIPRPSVTPAKIPSKSSKLEKRLSFPPNLSDDKGGISNGGQEEENLNKTAEQQVAPPLQLPQTNDVINTSGDNCATKLSVDPLPSVTEETVDDSVGEVKSPKKIQKIAHSSADPELEPAAVSDLADDSVWKLKPDWEELRNGQQIDKVTPAESMRNGQQAQSDSPLTGAAEDSRQSDPATRKGSQASDGSALLPDGKQQSLPASNSTNILLENDRQIILKEPTTASQQVKTAAAKPDGRRQPRANNSSGEPNSGAAAGGGGYMSDGDILKSSTLTSQLRLFDEDLTNGYISEGSAGLIMSTNGSSRRMTSRPRERMPLLRELNGRKDGFDYEDGISGGAFSNGSSSDSNRKATGTPNFSRSFPYSSLSYRSPHLETEEPSCRSSVTAMPLLRGPSLRATETRPPKPAPISPPPRDPETTLSTPQPSRLTSNGGATYPNSSTSTDNYLRIYASPVRKRPPPGNQTEVHRSDRNPGDLFTRPLDNSLSNHDPQASSSNLKSNLESRRVSGSTQTSPQDSAKLTGGHYSTNSLNRNVNRHAVAAPTAGYSVAQDGPPRCRSVVHSQGEMSVAPPTYSVGNPYMPSSAVSVYDASPLSPKMLSKCSPSRFSMPNQHGNQELTVYDIDRMTPQAAPVSALPPKAGRSAVRHLNNGHADLSSHELRDFDRSSSRSNGGQSSHGIYSRPGAAGRDGHFRENGLNGASMWDSHRSPSHTARGYPLTYSMNTHGPNFNMDEMENASTVSFPLSNTSRPSAPASPILTYSLPRQGQSSSLSLRSNNPGVSPYVGSLFAKIHSKDDEVHGSTGSLISTASSIYSSPEERHAHDVRKLRRELEQAQERVASLTNQLSTNTHVVAAFEHSLNNMSNRLEILTTSAQRKDGELVDLRRTIENLRRQGAEAGLISGVHPVVSPSLVRRHTFNSANENDERPLGLSRQMSTDSVASLNSLASNCSANELDEDGKKKNKKKSWVQSKECRKLRSSFSKAFSRGRPKTKNGSISDAEDARGHLPNDLSTSVPNSPLLQASRVTSRVSRNSVDHAGQIKSASSFSALDRMDEREENGALDDLQRQLREKEMVLNDFRLEALNSAQQLDQYKESMTRMKNEIENLRQDNLRLQRLVAVKRRSLSSERKSPHDGAARSTPSESGIGDDESPTFDARRVAVKVVKFENGSATESDAEDVSIGSVKISHVMRWDQLDKAVRQLFKEYISRLDVMVNLGLSSDSMACYHLGNALRNRDDLPSLDSSPIDFVKSDDEKIRVILKGSREHAVDLIAFESLIPKSILQRYVALISEHKRVILCGPSGTGKSFLARKIAQHLVLKTGRNTTEGAVATFCVDDQTSKDLRQYLMQIAEQCENNRDLDIPSVVIIDNLHHVGSLGELFNGFLSVKHHRCPFIIGTMNQSTCRPANLHLHHNFRWILCANHMEPVKGFLSRYLRRKIIDHEMNAGVCDSALTKIVEWIPRAWQQINTFLEKHSSSDVTVGPRLFLDCPMNVRESQLWFTSLWNYSLVPYILEAVKEGLQLYGRCAPWEDPTEWILQTYPWPTIGNEEDPEMHALNPVRQEDVGFESFGLNSRSKSKALDAVDEAETDPLSNMLLRLQEAARYSSHQNEAVGDVSCADPGGDHLTTTKSPTCA